MKRWLVPFLAVGGILGAACSTAPSDDAAEEFGDALTDVSRPDPNPDVLVKDPTTLVRLEDQYSFGSMLGVAAKSGAELLDASSAYRVLHDTVKADVNAIVRSDRAAGKGFAFGHRLFDDRWLGSKDIRFELTGIANRLDLEYRGGCGEVHFVYRLAYTTLTQPNVASSRVDSRLPFTVNVLVPIADDGQKCQTVARQWAALRPGASASDIAAGPLGTLGRPSRLEINFQIVRWPSGVRGDMGGHAEYMLRAFEFAGDDIHPVGLDDTPRTDLSAAEKKDLIAWIGENIAAIDDGTARLPERFLASTTTSVAPRASVRLANHTFSAVVDEASLRNLPLGETETVRSPRALLHKLDGMTCNGCHQSRGLAGFHLLGEERVGTERLNALAVGASPHLLDAVKWRRAFVESVAKGERVPRRLAADHVSGNPGAYGDHCTLDKDPGFAGWTCKSGLACKRVDDAILGRCMPPGPPSLGDACEESTVTQTLDSHVDTVSSRALACAEGARCFRASNGFPDGICERRCDELGVELGGDRVCSGVPFGTGPLGGFNKCLFTLKKPFRECLADDVRPTDSRACGDDAPCRDDYACVRVYVKPTGRATERETLKGACMPPYFVFQGRVDGHVLASDVIR